MLVTIAVVIAAAAVLAAIVVVAVGGGGELSAEHPDHPPLGLPGGRPVGGTDAALLRLPLGLWGYHKQITDEAMARFAHELTERDTRIAILEQELAETRQGPGVGAAGRRRSLAAPPDTTYATREDWSAVRDDQGAMRHDRHPGGDEWGTARDDRHPVDAGRPAPPGPAASYGPRPARGRAPKTLTDAVPDDWSPERDDRAAVREDQAAVPDDRAASPGVDQNRTRAPAPSDDPEEPEQSAEDRDAGARNSDAGHGEVGHGEVGHGEVGHKEAVRREDGE